MSVAFRRDSDEEHLEPKFELPIPAGPNLVTPRGLELIQRRQSELKERLEESADPAVRGAIERDLRYWQTRQITAELAPIARGDKVGFGTRVHIVLNGQAKTLQIVGDDEADSGAGLLSFNAPLSRAMLGAEPGDILPFGQAMDAIEIVQIEVDQG